MRIRGRRARDRDPRLSAPCRGRRRALDRRDCAARGGRAVDSRPANGHARPGRDLVNARALLIALLFSSITWTVETHSGPPFPIMSDQAAGPYVVSIWTDPDTTDDGSAGGQFWTRVHPAADGVQLP